MDWFNQSTYKIGNRIYSVPKLSEWAKGTLPLSQITIKDIIDRYIWADKLFIEVNDPEDDWEPRSMNTDLSYPILILQLHDGKWEIIDGNHRTWKAWKLGIESIPGYVIDSDGLRSVLT
jgi:ParB-like chromosome segregation protein Spo0J